MFRKKQDFSYVLVILLIILLSIIVISYLELGQTQLNNLRIYENSFQSKYNAESGIEDVKTKFKAEVLYDENHSEEFVPYSLDSVCSTYVENNSLNTPIREYKRTLNNGTYTVCIIEDVSSRVYVQYEDYLPPVLEQRTIQIVSVGDNKNFKTVISSTLELNRNVDSYEITIKDWNINK